MPRFICICLLCLALGACQDAVDPDRPVPDAPEHLLVSLRFTEIQLTWLDASSDEELFRIEVSVDSGPFLLLTEVARDVGVVKYPDPLPATYYRFRVAACNAAGCSEYREAEVNTNDWAAPTLSIANVQLVAPGAVSILVSAGGGLPVRMRLLVREAGVALGDHEWRNEEIEPGNPQSYYLYGLKPEATYTAQAFGENRFGTTQTEIRTFTTKQLIPPTIADGHVTELTPTTATLNVRIHPGGSVTTYHFTLVSAEWGQRRTPNESIPPDSAYRTAAERPLSSYRWTDLLPGAAYSWTVQVRGAGPNISHVGRFTTPSN